MKRTFQPKLRLRLKKHGWRFRKKTKTIYVGNVPVGGNNPISVQSMTNTDTCDVVSTINQINKSISIFLI